MGRSVREVYEQEGLMRTVYLSIKEGPKRIYHKSRDNILKYTASPSDYHKRFASSNYEIHEIYKKRGMDETSEFIHKILKEQNVSKTSNIIELGGNIGRHLNYLYEKGYENVHTIEINEDAIRVMEEEYPALYETNNIKIGSVENHIDDFEDDFFEVLFTVTVLQHIPKENDWILDDIARVTNNIIITIELEEDVIDKWTYQYRNYKDIFSARGFEQVLELNANEAPIAAHLKERPHVVRVFKKDDQ